MRTLTLRGEHITLAQALKAIGLADTGGQAKQMIRLGQVRVNSVVVTQPGRKLVVGDKVWLAGADEFQVVAGVVEGGDDS